MNEDIAGRLDEMARILAEQRANRFRVQAYHQAAAASRGLARPVSEILVKGGADIAWRQSFLRWMDCEV